MNIKQLMVEKTIIFYRKTIKSLKPIHAILHRIFRTKVVVLMEKISKFYTLPDDPLWYRIYLITGLYEKKTVNLVNQYVKKGMTVLDVGANVGFYTKLFSKCVGDSGNVIAFEPHPLTFNVLYRNVSRFKNVKLFQKAVSNENGTELLFDFLSDSGGSSLRYDSKRRDTQIKTLDKNEIIPRVEKNLPISSYSVETTTIDSCLSQEEIQSINFVKMDIEGAEIFALQGMRKIIGSSPDVVLIMEYNPEALRSFVNEPSILFDEIRKLGFKKIKIIKEDGDLIEPQSDSILKQLTKELTDSEVKINLICEKTS